MKKRENESYFSEVLDKLVEHRAAMAGLCVLVLEIVLVIILPPILKLNPYDSDYTAFSAAPGAAHILGTDAIGRDIFARLIYGGRTSLLVGLVSTMISCLVGVPLGLIAGYFRGKAEIVIMRVADIFMSFPSIVLILVLVAVLGPSIWSVTIVIGVLGWTQFARLIYANVLSVSEKEYVESARAIGTSDFEIITRYILPNSFAPILIAITFQMASAILTESSLSFLGMGVQPPGASWGNMLYDAQSISVLSKRLWMWMPPGIALLITVLSINFLGDGIRDALDPKIKI
ncbi:MAG: ABC transporter permease [Clostridiales bacterium]|nr:ABC transporter permease [Clostridiales bacterium]MCD8369170.1 ABC transporter permease [Clostridiales bacterium]